METFKCLNKNTKLFSQIHFMKEFIWLGLNQNKMLVHSFKTLIMQQIIKSVIAPVINRLFI